MRKAAVLTVLLILVICGGWAGTKTANADKEVSTTETWTAKQTTTTERTERCNKWKIVRGIRFYRASMWEWQWMEGVPFGRVSKWRPRHSCMYLRYLLVRAHDRSLLARNSYYAWFGRTYAKWECIHRHEGAWNDPNAPYYGGLQMDLSFQRSHGASWLRLWGTADKWPVWAQLRAAEDAYHSGRGFNPWPNTARYCGLL